MSTPTGAGNYPPGVMDSDPYFTDETESDDDEPSSIPCSRCGKPTTFDPTFGDLCYQCCRASNE